MVNKIIFKLHIIYRVRIADTLDQQACVNYLPCSSGPKHLKFMKCASQIKQVWPSHSMLNKLHLRNNTPMPSSYALLLIKNSCRQIRHMSRVWNSWLTSIQKGRVLLIQFRKRKGLHRKSLSKIHYNDNNGIIYTIRMHTLSKSLTAPHSCTQAHDRLGCNRVH